MSNTLQPSSAAAPDSPALTQNNSGGGSSITVPDAVRGWSFGAFMWNWVWAIFNRTWIGLLAIVPWLGAGLNLNRTGPLAILPLAGAVVAIYLGVKGRELAWRNKRWDSIEHFNRVQRAWSRWAIIVFGGAALLGILAAIVLPAYQEYLLRVKGGA